MFLPFVRGHFGDNESCRLPKTLLLVYCRSTAKPNDQNNLAILVTVWQMALYPNILYCSADGIISMHCRQKGLEQPKYMMETVDKQFRASVKVGVELFDKRKFECVKSHIKYVGGG